MSVINCANYFTSLRKEFQPTARNDEKYNPSGTAADIRKTELPDSDRSFLRFDDMIFSVPDVRESSVEEVLSSIGSDAYYNVKAEQIAEKIMKGDLLNELI